MRSGLRTVVLAAALLTMTSGAKADGIGDSVREAVDPDCSVGKAVKGAARKAVIGVRGNRCDAGETARDTLGIDDREQRDEDRNGPLSRLREND